MFMKYSKIFVLFVLFSLPFSLLQSAFAKKRTRNTKKKKKLVVNAALYDKVWQNFQIGTKKDKALSIKTLKSVLKKHPNEAMACYYLGVMLNEMGSSNKALRYLKKALDGFPKSADIHFRIAEIFSKGNKSSIALEYYRKTITLDKMHGGALSKVGISELMNDNIPEAIKLLSKAKEIQPDNPETLQFLGIAQLNSNMFSEAVENITTALRFNQKDAELHFYLAQAYDKLDEPLLAAKEFKLAKKLGKKIPGLKEDIGYNLADNLLKSGKIEQAIKEYKKQIKNSDDPGLGYYNIGKAYEDLGDDKNSIKAYILAYEYDRAHGEGIIKAANIYQRDNNWDKAIEMYSMLKRDKQYKDLAKSEIKEIQELQQQDYERSLETKAQDGTTASIEAAYLELLDINSKNEDALEGLRDYYEEHGYYKESMRYIRKLKKLGRYSDYDAKMTIKKLRARWKEDNQRLWMDNKPLYKSGVDDDQLENIAYNGENSRIREEAYLILLKRKNFKKDKTLIESQMSFYEEAGYYRAASKCVTKLKRYGYLTTSEAKDEKKRLKDKIKEEQ